MADADVHRYLKLFTFESLDALEILMEEHRKEPSKRVAQHKLAREILEIVHGSKIAEETEQEHRSLFKRPPVTLPQPATEGGIRPQDINRHVNKTAPIVNAENAPSYSLTLPRSLVYNQQISKVIYHGGLVASRSEGHRMVANRGVYIGARPGSTGTMGDQVDFSPALNWDGKETEKYIIDGEYLMIRIGKWKVKIIKIISDDEFEAQGLTAPGWKEEKPDVQEDVVKMKPRRGQRDIKQAPPHQKGVEAEAWDKPLSSYVP